MLLRSLFQRQRWNAAHSQESRSRRDNAPLRHSKLRARFVPRLEALEDRTVLSSYNAATVSDLIADINAANKSAGAACAKAPREKLSRERSSSSSKTGRRRAACRWWGGRRLFRFRRQPEPAKDGEEKSRMVHLLSRIGLR